MRVSVIIPTFNSATFVGDALRSVYEQSAAVSEVICVDDASTDNTVEFIKVHFPEVRIVTNNSNRGAAWCRNLGISIATGDLLAFLDSDDYWLYDKTQWQVEVLQSRPDLEMVGGLAEYFSEKEDGALASFPDGAHFNAYLATFLIRKSLFTKVGVFDETMRLSEDQDWFLRAREVEVKMEVKERTVLRIRVHDHNTTKDITFKNSGMMEVLKKSLTRRREAGAIENLKIIKPE
jgi:glycosyltransferase involved in cell wall biosynthesis